MFCFILKMVLL
jgi:hypothetical protein